MEDGGLHKNSKLQVNILTSRYWRSALNIIIISLLILYNYFYYSYFISSSVHDQKLILQDDRNKSKFSSE